MFFTNKVIKPIRGGGKKAAMPNLSVKMASAPVMDPYQLQPKKVVAPINMNANAPLIKPGFNPQMITTPRSMKQRLSLQKTAVHLNNLKEAKKMS
jgi:hypothetical protein